MVFRSQIYSRIRMGLYACQSIVLFNFIKTPAPSCYNQMIIFCDTKIHPIHSPTVHPYVIYFNSHGFMEEKRLNKCLESFLTHHFSWANLQKCMSSLILTNKGNWNFLLIACFAVLQFTWVTVKTHGPLVLDLEC